METFHKLALHAGTKPRRNLGGCCQLRRTPRAFTLTELLVVLAIVSVLAAIIMAAEQSAAQSGKQMRNVSNLRAIGTASISFAADNNGNLPPNGTIGAKINTVGYGVSQTQSTPPQWLVSKNVPFGMSNTGYLTPDQFYSPFTTTFSGRTSGKFFATNGSYGLIGYLFYYLPLNSVNVPPRVILANVSNDTVRASALTPIYSEFCAFSSAISAGNSTSSAVAVLYLDGNVRVFQEAAIQNSKPTGWSDVIKYFIAN